MSSEPQVRVFPSTEELFRAAAETFCRIGSEAIRQRELAKTLAVLKELPPHAQKAIEALSLGIINKLLHPPIAYLKNTSRSGDVDNAREVAVVRRMFGLDNDSE